VAKSVPPLCYACPINDQQTRLQVVSFYANDDDYYDEATTTTSSFTVRTLPCDPVNNRGKKKMITRILRFVSVLAVNGSVSPPR